MTRGKLQQSDNVIQISDYEPTRKNFNKTCHIQSQSQNGPMFYPHVKQNTALMVYTVPSTTYYYYTGNHSVVIVTAINFHYILHVTLTYTHEHNLMDTRQMSLHRHAA